MKNQRIAIRYAKALFLLSKEYKKTEEIKADMALILETADNTPDFKSFLVSPVIKEYKKNAAVKKIFENKISAITMKFISLVITKRRFNYIDYIAAQYLDLYRLDKGIKKAEIYTVVALNESNKTKIVDILKDFTQSDIELINEVEKEIIGGFVLNINDIQYDASIRNKLNKLMKEYSINIYEKVL